MLVLGVEDPLLCTLYSVQANAAAHGRPLRVTSVCCHARFLCYGIGIGVLIGVDAGTGFSPAEIMSFLVENRHSLCKAVENTDTLQWISRIREERAKRTGSWVISA